MHVYLFKIALQSLKIKSSWKSIQEANCIEQRAKYMVGGGRAVRACTVSDFRDQLRFTSPNFWEKKKPAETLLVKLMTFRFMCIHYNMFMIDSYLERTKQEHDNQRKSKRKKHIKAEVSKTFTWRNVAMCFGKHWKNETVLFTRWFVCFPHKSGRTRIKSCVEELKLRGELQNNGSRKQRYNNASVHHW